MNADLALLRAVCLAQIEKKIKKRQLLTTEAFFADVERLVTNAKLYNEEGSMVVADALSLQETCHKATEHQLTTVAQERRQLAQLPPKPKAPLSAFFMFCRDERPQIKSTLPQLSVTEMSKLLGERWRMLTPEARAPYDEESSTLRQEHQKQLREYHRMVQQIKAPALKAAKQKPGDKSKGSKALFNQVVKVAGEVTQWECFFVLT